MNNNKNNTEEMVSVVIMTWNRNEDLKFTLNALKKEQYKPLEVIVVDNGSIDQTISMMQNYFSEFKLIKLPKNVGVTALNIGIGKAKGKYIFILDNDAHPETDSISLAVNKFKENLNLGISVFKTIDQPTGFCPELKFEKGKTKEEKKKGIKVKIFRGCGVMIKREVIEKVGGYPDDFFSWGEESDVAMRVLHAGFEIRYYPELVIHHRLSPRSRSLSRKTYYQTRNTIWLYWKYSPIVMASLKTVYSAIFMGINSLKNKTVIYYFRGLVDGIKRLPVVMEQRQVVYTQTIRFQLQTAMLNLLKRRR